MQFVNTHGDLMHNETGDTPNKYTSYMGEMVRTAREEAGMTQEELAKLTYRKRLAISEMESGKVEISAWVLLYLTSALKKPYAYFFPPSKTRDIKEDSLNPSEHELISYFREISHEDLEKVAIDLVKVIAKFNPVEMLKENIDLALDEKQRDQEIEEFIKSGKKKSILSKK
jgi:transcriptional regulator with XRE-family HTH domain